MEADVSLSPFQSGIRCLCVVARFHNVPSHVAQLIREFDPSHDNLAEANIMRAAKHIGLKAKQAKFKADDLVKCSLPALGQHINGHYFVIAKSMKEGNEFLIHDLVTGKPEVFNKQTLSDIWTGQVILIAKRTGLIDAKVKFGISWFLPAIVKYKKFLTDVVIASFFIQFLGLASVMVVLIWRPLHHIFVKIRKRTSHNNLNVSSQTN